MQQTYTNPAIQEPHIAVFADDHGIAKTGLVMPYLQSNGANGIELWRGGADHHVFCRQNKLTLG